MRMYHLLPLIFIVLSFIGCRRSERILSKKEITLNTSIEGKALTKSPVLDDNGAGNFTDGDVFKLLVANSENEYDSFNYTVGKTKLYWSDLTVGNESSEVIFSAFYPLQVIENGSFVFDLRTASNKDLLIAQGGNVAFESENPVNLRFRHAMHKLKIKFNVEGSLGQNTIQTKCLAKSTCTVNILNNSLVTDQSPVSEFRGTGNEVDFIIVPQKAADVSLEITIGEMIKRFKINELNHEIEDLKSGMQLTVEITVKNGKIEISNMGIAGWEDQGSISGEIIM